MKHAKKDHYTPQIPLAFQKQRGGFSFRAFPWGDVPAPWVSGYGTIYDTGIDDSVFLMEEELLTSLTDDDHGRT